MDEAIQISTTVSDQADAERIAAALVAKKLVACARVTGPVESTYRWKGRIESSQEWVCTSKTIPAAYDAVETAIRAIHSYEEPEIIALPIVRASESYLKWIAECVELGHESVKK